MNGGVVGVFIAPTTKLDRWWRLSVVWCTGQSGAHRTCSVRQPRHQCRWILTVGVLTFGPAWMSGGAPDMNCSLSGVPAWACLPSARFWRALNAPAGDRWREEPLLRRCTGQSGVHRTCPVNYSGAAAAFSRGWRVPEAALPWSTGHRTVR
jgi:hypothetical protein